jgi:hypothetical protein
MPAHGVEKTAVMHIYSFICPFFFSGEEQKQHSPLFTYFCRLSCSMTFFRKDSKLKKTHRREIPIYKEFIQKNLDHLIGHGLVTWR